MSVRLFEDNRLFDGLPSTSLVPSSQSATLPATNTQNSARTRVWRTGNSLLTETLTIDFGSPVTIDACILFYTTIDTVTGGDSNVMVQANSANSWSSPPFSMEMIQGSITDAQQPENYFYSFFGDAETSPSMSPPTFRYWRISFTKSSAIQTRDIGRIFLGICYDVAALPMANGGVQLDLNDNSNKSKGVGLNTYVEILPQFQVITIGYTPMSQTDLANYDVIFKRLGQKTSFFVQIDQINPYKEIFYVKSASPHTKKLSLVTPTTTYWAITHQFEEQL